MALEINDPNISAKEMAEAISSVATILLNNQILSNNGYTSLCKVAAEIKAFKNSKAWNLCIDRDFPILFNDAENVVHESSNARVELSSKSISVNLDEAFPFKVLDISVLIKDSNNNKVLSRWHFDLANRLDSGEMQSGPLTHIQYGGRVVEQDRSEDHPLKIPRWCHPPMDIILLCEVIVANFFPKKWDLIRETPSWCDAISTCQRICYSAYLRKMVQTLGISSTTILHEMDANIWSKSLSS